jgi:hypothetical protein
MFKRFSHFFAYLLLVLMPVHSLATANMLVCNSMMQSQAVNQSVGAMPCHQPMTNITNADETNLDETMHSDNQGSPCKASCASVCANMCAMIAMPPASIQSTFVLNLTQDFDFNSQPYVSITQPNLQRPPISFI